MTQLTTKTAQELKRLKNYLGNTSSYSIGWQVAKQEYDMAISVKNELKEIIKLPMVKEHIELLIEEIESVEK